MEKEDIVGMMKNVFSNVEIAAPKLLLDKHKVADFCSFCGSSHIAERDHHAGIKPALVSFQITKDAAVEKFRVWIRKKYFAPSKLKQSYKLELAGAYIPYWTLIPRRNQITSYKLALIIMSRKHAL